MYHPDQDHRAVFKSAVQHYLDLRDQQRSLKTKIKAKYHRAGVLRTEGRRVYSEQHRAHYLAQLPDASRRTMVSHLYALLDVTLAAQEEALGDMVRLGRRYPEIREFMKMPGVGPISAHVFSAFIQTPHRFATHQKLWRYCKLGIVDRSSSGKPLAYKRLDRAGNGELKAVSYRIYLSALRTSTPNEVTRFYEASLATTGNATHARLNTQRKVLAVLWTIWKHNVVYKPELFSKKSPTAVEGCQAARA